MQVVLKRIPKEILSKKRMMLEHLRLLQECAARRGDTEISNIVNRLLAQESERESESNNGSHGVDIQGIDSLLTELAYELGVIHDDSVVVLEGHRCCNFNLHLYVCMCLSVCLCVCIHTHTHTHTYRQGAETIYMHM
jgi:hypothetical protein